MLVSAKNDQDPLAGLLGVPMLHLPDFEGAEQKGHELQNQRPGLEPQLTHLLVMFLGRWPMLTEPQFLICKPVVTVPYACWEK